MNLSSPHKFNRTPLVVGAVVFFVLLFLLVVAANRSRNFQNTQTFQIGNKGAATSLEKSGAHFLVVSQPEDNLVVQNPRLTVNGETTAGATVVVIAGEENQITEVGSNGKFSVNLTLQEGATTIEVTSFAQNGEEKNVTREVFYSQENL